MVKRKKNGRNENEIGNFIGMIRAAKGYSREMVSSGICSQATLSRIENGEQEVNALTARALLDRMKVLPEEYELLLDEGDFEAYCMREKIRILSESREDAQAEECLAEYEEKYGADTLSRQFLLYYKAVLTKRKEPLELEKARELFLKAISVTAPDFREKLRRAELLNNMELICYAGLVSCINNSMERESEFEVLYHYFLYCRIRDEMMPEVFCFAMQYYAECLYENGKAEECIRLCDEVLQEIYQTAKVKMREDCFLLRARAREQAGFRTESDKQKCIQDFVVAYHLTAFYRGEEQAEELGRYIAENYGWKH